MMDRKQREALEQRKKIIQIVPLQDVRIKKGKSRNKREFGAEECTCLIWDHDVWEDEGG